MTALTDADLWARITDLDHRKAFVAELLRRDRAAAIKQAVALLLAMAEDAERFAASSMARLDDLAKAGAYREAARRVAELG